MRLTQEMFSDEFLLACFPPTLYNTCYIMDTSTFLDFTFILCFEEKKFHQVFNFKANDTDTYRIWRPDRSLNASSSTEARLL